MVLQQEQFLFFHIQLQLSDTAVISDLVEPLDMAFHGLAHDQLHLMPDSKVTKEQDRHCQSIEQCGTVHRLCKD